MAAQTSSGTSCLAMVGVVMAAQHPRPPSRCETASYDLGNDRVVLLLVPAHSSAGRSADGDDHHAAGGALAELRAAAANGLGFELRTARSFGRSRPLATLRIGPPVPAEQTEALRFNPWTTGPGDPPGRLAEPAPRRRLPGEPTRP